MTNDKSDILCLENVSFKFSTMTTPTIANVKLTLAKGEILGLLGASGCGKTTLLRIIAGFVSPSAGTVAIADKVAVMHHGKLLQVGTPEEIYYQPASCFVAQFVTQANFLPAKHRGEFWETEIGFFRDRSQKSGVGSRKL
ncbi:ATP-binding cassette domain-containing protein [Chroococcidiopsis sp. FACHB-1243]|nr:ATP-binding cassette domain-containing protein [Chroococcidiopsis sp. [FACHB-1243]]MBD2304458.1 ATP-binding cassette domain-containing protein [Chroococcidiopsis sp. [FACHB-1243]]